MDLRPEVTTCVDGSGCVAKLLRERGGGMGGGLNSLVYSCVRSHVKRKDVHVFLVGFN